VQIAFVRYPEDDSITGHSIDRCAHCHDERVANACRREELCESGGELLPSAREGRDARRTGDAQLSPMLLALLRDPFARGCGDREAGDANRKMEFFSRGRDGSRRTSARAAAALELSSILKLKPITQLSLKMTKSRIALVVLALAAMTAVGFSAASSNASASDDCSTCTQGCAGCCHK